jgi:hypothetical protein
MSLPAYADDEGHREPDALNEHSDEEANQSSQPV